MLTNVHSGGRQQCRRCDIETVTIYVCLLFPPFLSSSTHDRKRTRNYSPETHPLPDIEGYGATGQGCGGGGVDLSLLVTMMDQGERNIKAY